RSLGRLVFGSPTEMPSTVTVPFWNGSSAFTHLISVDLPDPDGPQTTITSPFSTLVVQSVRTWNWPYHLETLSIEIIGVPLKCHPSADDGDLLLQAFDQIRKRVADDEVHRRHEQVHLDQPPVALRDLRGRADEVGGRDHVYERSVLEQDDGLREQDRNHVAESLREDHQPHRLSVGEPQRVRGVDLSLRDRLDAGAHDLAEVRRLEHDEGDDRGALGPDLNRPLGAGQHLEHGGHEEEEPEDHQH